MEKNHIEESNKNNKKKYSQKEEGKDLHHLFQQCQTHLGKLDQQLRGYLDHQRNKQLNPVLPVLDNLSSEVKLLKENVDYEPTVEEKRKERMTLAEVKH